MMWRGEKNSNDPTDQTKKIFNEYESWRHDGWTMKNNMLWRLFWIPCDPEYLIRPIFKSFCFPFLLYHWLDFVFTVRLCPLWFLCQVIQEIIRFSFLLSSAYLTYTMCLCCLLYFSSLLFCFWLKRHKVSCLHGSDYLPALSSSPLCIWSLTKRMGEPTSLWNKIPKESRDWEEREKKKKLEKHLHFQ